MQAIVLAGGLGTRLRSVVGDLPKPLAPVAGRPFIGIILDDLARQGVSLAVLSVGYRHEMIVDAIGHHHRGMVVRYSVESSPLGTGGAIWKAMSLCTEDSVLVLNGDSYVAANLQDLMAMHIRSGGPVTICTTVVDDGARYGAMRVQDSRIVAFTEKGTTGSAEINAGVYCLKRNVLGDYQMPAAFSFERDFLAAHLDSLRPAAFCSGAQFIDIGVPEDFARAQAMFAVRNK
jgi:D-glycero-alpha-D-manno-heptose 1-phosphate guanylyltransferase